MTNNCISKSFNLHCGTRQGCALPPLLFVLALEPFAISIRKHPIIKGIQIADVEHGIAFFTDDTLVYLTNLEISFSALTEEISRFGKSSGYKVNKTKLSVFLINKQEQLCSTALHKFLNAPQGCKYLGIFITSNLNSLVSTNFKPVISKAKESLNRWTSLPSSLIGCKKNVFQTNS